MTEIKISCVYTKIIPLEDLHVNPDNPNKHDDAQIDRLSKLFSYEGIRHPIIVSKRSGFIVAGHGRLLAAKKLGMKDFPVDYQEFESDEQEYAFLVNDNAIASWSELELGKINDHLSELDPSFDLEMLAIKNFEIEPLEKFPEIIKDDSIIRVTFVLSTDQRDTIENAIKISMGHELIEDEINENKRGIALAAICERYALGERN